MGCAQGNLKRPGRSGLMRAFDVKAGVPTVVVAEADVQALKLYEQDDTALAWQ